MLTRIAVTRRCSTCARLAKGRSESSRIARRRSSWRRCYRLTTKAMLWATLRRDKDAVRCVGGWGSHAYQPEEEEKLGLTGNGCRSSNRWWQSSVVDAAEATDHARAN